MEKSEDFMEIVSRIVHKYTIMEKKKRYYGTNINLTYGEIHTIARIGLNEEMTVTQLAKTQGVTKGAVSQMINRLADKGLLIKKTSPESEAKIHLVLSDAGKEVYQGHIDYHKQQGDFLSKKMNELPDDQYKKIISYMRSFEEILDKMGKVED